MSNNTTSASEDFVYQCINVNDATDCAPVCVGLAACQACQCAAVPTERGGGPWGAFMDVVFCLLPIVFLVVVTVKPHPMPTTRSLPCAAALMFLVRTMYLDSDPLLTCASVILGLHEALTPLSIMAGAITLFETMEATYCMPYMMREMKALTAGHPVAELMLIFAFCYMVEGASGFGTPVALGAPMLVSSGHPAFQSVVVLLVFNGFATVWGAVGTPIWFGFGNLGLSQGDFLEISGKAAVALAIGAVPVVPLVLRVLVPWAIIRRSIYFVLLSLLVCIGPSLTVAFFNYEFPSLLGGLIGCGLTAALIKCKAGLTELDGSQCQELGRSIDDIGSVSERHGLVCEWQKTQSLRGGADGDRTESNLERGEAPPEASQLKASDTTGDVDEGQPIVCNAEEAAEKETGAAVGQSLRDLVEQTLGPRKGWNEGYLLELLKRTFPIWGVVLLLVLTRVDQIGIKPYLTMQKPYFEVYLGSWGTFRCSASIVLQLLNILAYPGMNWKYDVLYVPFILPFLLVSGLTLALYRRDLQSSPRRIAGVVAGRLAGPAVALLGAMALVQLMVRTGAAAPAVILGSVLADWFRGGFVVVSPLLGALGSFFSGSTTVSNLTFGGVQAIAADAIGTSVTTLLALQSVGASAGNGVCLNNIIAAGAVVGLPAGGEGRVLARTVGYVLANLVVGLVATLAFFFRLQ